MSSMLGSQAVKRRPVKPETAGSNPAPAANEAKFWEHVDAQPNCVRCDSKCHQRGNRQLCCWCGQAMSFELTWHWHNGRKWQVRTWA